MPAPSSLLRVSVRVCLLASQHAVEPAALSPACRQPAASLPPACHQPAASQKNLPMSLPVTGSRATARSGRTDGSKTPITRLSFRLSVGWFENIIFETAAACPPARPPARLPACPTTRLPAWMQMHGDLRLIQSRRFAAKFSLRFPRVDRVRWSVAFATSAPRAQAQGREEPAPQNNSQPLLQGQEWR